MNGAPPDKTFVPKQALAPTAELYNVLASRGADKIAKASLAFTAPIPRGSIVHDNGCGTGVSSAAILASLADGVKPCDILIKATDVADQALTAYTIAADKRGAGEWPTSAWETRKMNACDLAFDDESFTHSLMSLVIGALPNRGIGAMEQVLRTLKPGGIAVINWWSYLPNIAALRAASEATRPSDTPRMLAMAEDWSAEDLRRTMEAAGFAAENVAVYEINVPISCPDGVRQFSFMLWSFLGGSTSAGWLQSDEEHWDEAIAILENKFRESDNFEEFEDGSAQLVFKAVIAVAIK